MHGLKWPINSARIVSSTCKPATLIDDRIQIVHVSLAIRLGSHHIPERADSDWVGRKPRQRASASVRALSKVKLIREVHWSRNLFCRRHRAVVVIGPHIGGAETLELHHRRTMRD